MTVQDHSRALMAALLVAAMATLALSCTLGPTGLPAGTELGQMILWEVRLPRALAAFGTGLALGASGAALQALLRNPLAEPGVLGVSAGASLAATTVLYWGLTAVSAWVLPLAAIAGALAVTALLAALAPRVGSVVTLVLVGVGLSALCGAVMSLLVNLAPNPFSLADMINWMMGSVANRSLGDVGLALPFWIAAAGLLALAAPGLRALGLGEETARSVGVSVGRVRLLVVLATGLATGAAVAVAGAVGFVGIVAPHLVRPAVGHDPVRAIAPAALLGGSILVLADLVVRLAPTGQELKLGVVAALIGAPVFIAIAARRRALEMQP